MFFWKMISNKIMESLRLKWIFLYINVYIQDIKMFSPCLDFALRIVECQITITNGDLFVLVFDVQSNYIGTCWPSIFLSRVANRSRVICLLALNYSFSLGEYRFVCPRSQTSRDVRSVREIILFPISAQPPKFHLILVMQRQFVLDR